VAKYLATEYGHAAADASIQALGGYGYAREYMVEKITRDVRITRIYEGTSEIMEMTIGRDRWQQYLKTRGQHYQEGAAALRGLEGRYPGVGAGTAALGLDALAAVLEAARVGRLTRNQHVLFQLGALIARAEGAASLARRAAGAMAGTLQPRSDQRFQPEDLAAVSRIYARQAADAVASQGRALIAGAAGQDGAMGPESVPGLEEISRAQAGLIQDQDRVADVIYDRI